MSCCAVCSKRFGFRGLKIRYCTTCDSCHTAVCGRCYRQELCCTKVIEERVEEIIHEEEMVCEEEVAPEEAYGPYSAVLVLLVVLQYYSAIQHLALRFTQYLAYLVVIFLAHFVCDQCFGFIDTPRPQDMLGTQEPPPDLPVDAGRVRVQSFF